MRAASVCGETDDVPTALVLDYALARPRRLLAALAAAGIDAKLSETPLQAKNAELTESLPNLPRGTRDRTVRIAATELASMRF